MVSLNTLKITPSETAADKENCTFIKAAPLPVSGRLRLSGSDCNRHWGEPHSLMQSHELPSSILSVGGHACAIACVCVWGGG